MSPLVLTIAHNGYDAAYRSCIRSQADYCRSHGFSHVVVRRPFRVGEVALSAWLKISLLKKALSARGSWTAFIDADARIRSESPDFRTVDDGEHSVYAARGRSGRFNSGVIFARPDEESRSFFDSVLQSAEHPVPDEDRQNLRFENGNFIAVARRTRAVAEIPLAWNNTYQTGLDDHIRHFTGPLRGEHRPSRTDGWIYRQRQRMVTPAPAQPESRDDGFLERLTALTDQVTRCYPSILSPR